AATPSVPKAPMNLATAPVSSSQINLTWQDKSNNETGFKIFRSTDGTSFTQVGSVGANIKTYSDGGLLASTFYYYRVFATNAVGDSDASNTASATTLPTPPAAPNGLGATAISGSQIKLSWQDLSNNESGFKIERSTNGVSFTQIATVGANIT